MTAKKDKTERKKSVKLTDEQRKKIIEAYNANSEHGAITRIAVEFGISAQTVSYTINHSGKKKSSKSIEKQINDITAEIEKQENIIIKAQKIIDDKKEQRSNLCTEAIEHFKELQKTTDK